MLCGTTKEKRPYIPTPYIKSYTEYYFVKFDSKSQTVPKQCFWLNIKPQGEPDDLNNTTALHNMNNQVRYMRQHRRSF